MQHLILSCLESRVEENGALFGRYLLGPFRTGQATTIATALRRALLSEVRGIAITGAEIRGACHQYSSIKGVRESALDILLNLKQVVLSGAVAQDLPAIGYIDVQGPKVVTSGDLALPNGISCVNSKQLIATLSSTGLLQVKFIISAGKSSLTFYAQSAYSLSKEVFQPKARWGEAGKMSLYTKKRFKQKWRGQQKSSSLNGSSTFNSKAFRTLWGKKENTTIYIKRRRLDSLNLPPEEPVSDLSHAFSSHSSHNTRWPGAEKFNRRKEPLPIEEKLLGGTNQPLKKIIEVNSSRLKEKLTGDHKSGSSIPNKRSTKHGFDTRKAKPLFFDKSIDKFQEVTAGPLEADLGLDDDSRSVLPVNPIFAPITRVNFAIQIDEQWQEPRERVIFEVWSNGSINPRQAIHEAATNLVYSFSLLRSI